MIKKLIIKSNMNVQGMIRHGSIATFTMFTIGYFFGAPNMMLAFPIALTAIAFSKQNLYIKTFRKTMRLLLTYWIIVTLSLIGTINPFLGIPINFITIFSIGYFLTIGYNPTIYKPFLMLFVFTNFIQFSSEALVGAIMSITFGVIVVVLSELLIIKSNNKAILKDTISKSVDILIQQINTILIGEFDEVLYSNHSKEMRDLCYKIYITRYRGTLTTNLGKVKYDIYISLEKFNIYLKEFCCRNLLNSLHGDNNKLSLNKEDAKFLKEVRSLLNSIKEYAQENIKIEELNSRFQNIENQYIKKEGCYSYREDVIEILGFISKGAIELYDMDSKEMNKLYKEWERSDIERLKDLVRSNYKKGSIRVNYALRLSIVLTLSLFVGHILGYYKIIWISITVMSVMQPYYEDTLKRTKERLRGNLIGVTFIIFILSSTQNRIIPIIILVLSLYLTFAFKEYYKLSIFTTLASMSVASLYAPTTTNAMFRLLYVVIGLLIILIANKLLFPYRLETGMIDLIRKLLAYDKLLIQEKARSIRKNFNDSIYNTKKVDVNYRGNNKTNVVKYVGKFKKNVFYKFKPLKDRRKIYNVQYNNKRVRDLIILSTLTADKLSLRNIQIRDSVIDKIIDENNKFIIEVAYDILKSSGER